MTTSASSRPTGGIAGGDASILDTIALRATALAGTGRPVSGAMTVGSGGGGTVVDVVGTVTGTPVVLVVVAPVVEVLLELDEVDEDEDPDEVEGPAATACRVGR
jgi:hypothetical protein